ncbi:hypothetical protein PAXINDRAFT_8743 [Paxillus involutus ATCC 200175]|nr:hypothetical protein PAXINDRAFT_8743 [Paxillus involutus ATCC 200175]
MFQGTFPKPSQAPSPNANLTSTFTEPTFNHHMANRSIPCFICQKDVQQNQMNAHSRQHSVADLMAGAQHWWNVVYGRRATPGVTPSPSPVPGPMDPHPLVGPPPPVQKRHEPNAFTIWLQDNAHDSSQYTKIDG